MKKHINIFRKQLRIRFDKMSNNIMLMNRETQKVLFWYRFSHILGNSRLILLGKLHYYNSMQNTVNSPIRKKLFVIFGYKFKLQKSDLSKSFTISKMKNGELKFLYEHAKHNTNGYEYFRVHGKTVFVRQKNEKNTIG